MFVKFTFVFYFLLRTHLDIAAGGARGHRAQARRHGIWAGRRQRVVAEALQVRRQSAGGRCRRRGSPRNGTCLMTTRAGLRVQRERSHTDRLRARGFIAIVVVGTGSLGNTEKTKCFQIVHCVSEHTRATTKLTGLNCIPPMMDFPEMGADKFCQLPSFAWKDSLRYWRTWFFCFWMTW